MPDLILAPLTFDLEGYVELELDGNKDALVERERRTSVTATLDGGVAQDDGGYAPGDRQWTVKLTPTAAVLSLLIYLVETYPQIVCSTKEGFFTVAPKALRTPAGKQVQLSLLVISKEV